MPEKIEVLVEGGAATPGPPLGPALGPLGVNIVQIVSQINAKTKDFAGMKVPVKITIDPKTKSFDISVGTPPTSALLLKEIGKETGAKGEKDKPGKETVGNITMQQAIKVAKMKSSSILGKDLRKSVKEVIGTCTSMGITVEEKPPKQILKDIDAGFYNEVLMGK